MKIIRQTSLHFQEGKSDKVYEVDLVEINADQYLVNFRYGRRGNALREGCKTNSPVDLNKAQEVFNSLLVSKINKGYQVVSGVDPLADKAPEVTSNDTVTSLNSRDLRIKDRLEKFTQGKQAITSYSSMERIPYIDGYSLSRTVWKAGEFKIQSLTDVFGKLIGKGQSKQNDMLNYSLAWAIGRIKDSKSLLLLDTLQDNLGYNLHYIIDEARLALADNPANALPASDIDFKSLAAHASAAQMPHREIIALYQHAKVNSELHQLLRENLKRTPLNKGFMRNFRTLYKIAEFRQDYAILAILNHKVDNTPALPWQWNKDIQAYSRNTREYFRRRMVRQVKNTGKNLPDDYTALATQILLQVDDSESQKRLKPDNNSFFDPLLLAANHILYANSERYKLSAGKTYWFINRNAKDTGRTDAYSALWNAAANDAFTLLMQCKAVAVNNFSLSCIESQQGFCKQISLNDLLTLVQKPYRNTAIFAATYLKPNINSIKVLRAVLNSVFEEVRQIALDSIDESLLKKQPELLAEMLCSPYDNIYQYAKDHLYTAKNREKELSDALIDTLISQPREQAKGDEDEPDKVLEQVRWLLLNPLKAKASLPAIERLLKSDPLSLKILATELLETSNYDFNELKNCYHLMMSSEHPEVQAGAIALLNKLNDREKIKQKELIFNALISEAPLMREKAIPVALSVQDRRFQHDTFNAILPALFKKEPVDGFSDDMMKVVEGLEKIHQEIDKDVVWRLLSARSKMADRAGAILIQARSDQEFSIKQIAILGKSSNVSVRNWSLNVFQKDTRRVERDFEDALRILDNPWAATRAKAIEFFRNSFSKNDWDVTRIIGVCDNVYEDTQRFGRELVSQFFEDEKGEEYLLKLSQHPSGNVQLFVSSFLESYASGKSSVILQLAPYFKTVLSQVNKSRIIKDRIIRFLFNESDHDEQVAHMVGDLFSDQSITVVLADKSKYIATLLQLQSKHNDIKTPLKVIQPERRAAL